MEPGWVLNLDLEGVDDVAASLAVNDSAGRKIVAVRGRKGEKLTLRNLVLPSVAPDAGASAVGGRCWYVVVRADNGLDREHRYVVHAEAVLPEARGGFETEPNDDAVHASALVEGTTTGYLSVGDVDVFRYLAAEPRGLDIEVTPPSRVRVKVEVIRERDGQVLAEAVAARARQTVRILGFSAPVEPILVRLSQGKYDGNASEPYLLKVASRLLQRDAGRRDSRSFPALARSRAREGRSRQDLRSWVQNHDTCVTDRPGPSFLLQVGQHPAWARNLSILRRLWRSASAFLTDRRRCCKP